MIKISDECSMFIKYFKIIVVSSVGWGGRRGGG